jgi:hypothetical protein
MRWQKLSDWDSLTKNKSRLLIPGEHYYRMWEHLRMNCVVLPLPRVGIESFLLDAFLRVHELEQRRDVENQMYWTAVALMLVQCVPEASVSQQVVDRIMAMFWKWHRTVEPGAVKPTGSSADELLKQMDNMKAIFENQAGIEVMAANPLGLKGGAGGS